MKVRWFLVFAALASAAAFLAWPPGVAAQSATTVTPNRSFAGTWEGKMDGLPGIDLRIAEAEGKISGAAIFYFQERHNGNGPWDVTVEYPAPLQVARLEGKTLTFEPEHHECHGCAELGPNAKFRMELTGSNQAHLSKLDDQNKDQDPGPELKLTRRIESTSWQDPSKHRVQFVTVEEGVRLEVLDWGGSGRPIVLLAGLGFSAHVFDGLAEELKDSYHVYGISRRGYGASSRPASGYTEERLAEDDLQVFDALGLVAPVIAGHSVAGNELSQLGIHHYDRIGALVYLDALNDGADDYTDYDALCAKLPEAMRKRPSPTPADLKSFAAYREWRLRTQGIAIPEAELRNQFAQNPDGSVGSYKIPGYVRDAIMAGGGKHDYSEIRVPVLAFVGYPGLPQDQIRENHLTDAAERTIVEAVFGTYVGMTKNRIKRIDSAAGGARVVELWGANHFVFLSNGAEVLRRLHAFVASLDSQ
jgi:non-heme chloroperoxidase